MGLDLDKYGRFGKEMPAMEDLYVYPPAGIYAVAMSRADATVMVALHLDTDPNEVYVDIRVAKGENLPRGHIKVLALRRPVSHLLPEYRPGAKTSGKPRRRRTRTS